MYTKHWYESKTIWLAIGQASLGILVAIDNYNPALGLTGIILIVKSMVDIYLRYSSTKTIV